MKLQLIGLFINFAGPVTLLALLVWLHCLYTIFFRGNYEWKWREWIWIVVISLVATTATFLSTNVDFKVLSDETNLLSVANMLSTFGKASNTESWVYYYQFYSALDVQVPTRPLLFPLLTSLVQMVVGVKPWTPFVVNFICLFLLYCLSLRFATKRFSREVHPLFISALALLMSPVLAIVSTSAGFDLCSLLIAFSSFLLLDRYYERKDSETLAALFFALICFAHVRYESIVALPIVAIFLFATERFAVIKKLPWGYYALGLLAISPLLLQRYLTWGSFENPPDVPAFSFSHTAKHFPIFVKSFFLDGKGPYPILLHWLGLLGLGLALVRARGLRWAPIAYGFFLLTLLLSHHFGLAGHPTQVRLFLTISFALSMLGLYAISNWRDWVETKALVPAFLILFVHHHQYAIHDTLMTQLTMTREVRHLRDFIDEEWLVGDIFVYDRPGQLTALGLSAISWAEFNGKRESYIENLKKKLYRRMFVIERVPYAADADHLPLAREGYRLTPMREHQLTPEERLRVSRVDW